MRSYVIAGLLAVCALAHAEKALVKKVTVDAPVQEVWKTWTTAEGIKTFFAPDARVELAPQGRFEIYFSKAAPVGQRGSEGCQVLSYVPEKMLSFSWNAPPQFPAIRGKRTFVVIELEPEGAKTGVTLTHGGWGEGGDWNKVYGYFDKAWDYVLRNLQKRFADGPLKWPEEQPAPLAQWKMPEGLGELSKFVGSVWRGEIGSPNGPLVIEFKYEWTEDKKGIRGFGVVGKGSKDPMYIRASYGVDPLTGGVYYLDVHNSDHVYFGHMALEGQDMVFTFGPAGGNPNAFSSRGRFLDKDTYGFVIRDKDGKEQVTTKLYRVRS